MGGSTPQVPTAPTPTPPVTPNNAASVAVEQATYRQQLRRKGIGQTTFAGANMPSSQGMQGALLDVPCGILNLVYSKIC